MTQHQQLNPQADALLTRIDGLERQVSDLQAEIDAASQLRSLGLLAGAIAHEFNNILTPVLSYARAALDAPEDHELTHKALARAAGGVERASRLAGSVLMLAGSDGAADLQPPCCDPADALRAALDCLDRPLNGYEIDLRTEFDPDLRLAIHPTNLEHVLLNLVLNSIRAMGSGGGQITARSRPARPGECSTWNIEAPAGVLEVCDSGPGIEPALVPSLFEPFAKGAGRTSPRHGHGLGLSICRQLVEAAGGKIMLGEGQSKGAAFSVILPARIARAGAA